MNLWPVLFVDLIVIIFGGLFLIFGLSVHCKVNRFDDFKMPFGFFAGGSLFLSLWRLSEFLLGARFSFWFTTILFFLVCARLVIKKKVNLVGVSWLKLTILLLITQLAVILFWSQSPANGAFSMVGSLHSPRYANIARYIFINDHIPLIGQNFAQSMLAAIPSYVGVNFPLLALSLWLGLCVFFLIQMTFQFFINFPMGRTNATWGTCAVVFGNTALSYGHVLVIDSGSPIFLNGYSDTLFSLASLIFSLYGFNSLMRGGLRDESRFKKYFFLEKYLPVGYLVLIFFSWTMLGVQNFWLFAAGALSILLAEKSLFRQRIGFLLALVGGGVLVLIISRFSGGMLTVLPLQEKLDIGGLMVAAEGGKGFEVYMGLPFLTGSTVGWTWQLDPHSTWLVRLFGSAFVIFWPALGIVIFNILVARNGGLKRYHFLSGVMWVCFLAGLFIALPFSFGSAKWEMSRFMLPGFYLGLIALIYSVYIVFSSKLLKFRGLAIFTVMVALAYGPLESIKRMYDINLYSDLTIIQNINAVLNYKEYVH